jgi:hypothetical protein
MITNHNRKGKWRGSVPSFLENLEPPEKSKMDEFKRKEPTKQITGATRCKISRKEQNKAQRNNAHSNQTQLMCAR